MSDENPDQIIKSIAQANPGVKKFHDLGDKGLGIWEKSDRCSYCGKAQTSLKAANTKLKPCPCRRVQYCNPECQKAHWVIHKHMCSYNKTRQQKPDAAKKDEKAPAATAAKAPQPAQAPKQPAQAPKQPQQQPAPAQQPVAAQRQAAQATFGPQLKALLDDGNLPNIRAFVFRVVETFGMEAVNIVEAWSQTILNPQQKQKVAQAAQQQATQKALAQAQLEQQQKSQVALQQQQQQQLLQQASQQQLLQQQALAQLNLQAQAGMLPGSGMLGVMPMHGMVPGLMPGMMAQHGMVAGGMVPAMPMMNTGLMNPAMNVLLGQGMQQMPLQ